MHKTGLGQRGKAGDRPRIRSVLSSTTRKGVGGKVRLPYLSSKEVWIGLDISERNTGVVIINDGDIVGFKHFPTKPGTDIQQTAESVLSYIAVQYAPINYYANPHIAIEVPYGAKLASPRYLMKQSILIGLIVGRLQAELLADHACFDWVYASAVKRMLKVPVTRDKEAVVVAVHGVLQGAREALESCRTKEERYAIADAIGIAYTAYRLHRDGQQCSLET